MTYQPISSATYVTAHDHAALLDLARSTAKNVQTCIDVTATLMNTLEIHERRLNLLSQQVRLLSWSLLLVAALLSVAVVVS